MRFDMGRIDHLRISTTAVASEFAKQVFPDAALGPAHETVIDSCARPVFGRTIAPAAAALENVNDAADHAAIVYPIHPTHIRGQMRFDAGPLLIVQPKKIAAHDPILFQNESGSYGIRIVQLQQHN
jgi:hypothetical protein